MGRTVKVCILAFLILSIPGAAYGQMQPVDMIDILSVDVVRKGGENVLYKNGVKLNKSQTRILFTMSPEALHSMNKAYRNRAIGRSLAFVGGAMFGGGIGAACGGENVGAFLVLAAVGGGVVGAGVPFIKAYNRHSSHAVDAYNRAVFHRSVPRQTAQLNFGLTSSGGIGIKCVF